MLRELTERLATYIECYARFVGTMIITALLEVFNEAFKLLLVIVLVYGLGHLLLIYCERNLSNMTWPFKGPFQYCTSSSLKVHIRQLHGSLTEFEGNHNTLNMMAMLDSELPETTAKGRKLTIIDSELPETTANGSELTLRESQSSESSESSEINENVNKRNRKISCNLDDDSILDNAAGGAKVNYRHIRFEPS